MASGLSLVVMVGVRVLEFDIVFLSIVAYRYILIGRIHLFLFLFIVSSIADNKLKWLDYVYSILCTQQLNQYYNLMEYFATIHWNTFLYRLQIYQLQAYYLYRSVSLTYRRISVTYRKDVILYHLFQFFLWDRF